MHAMHACNDDDACIACMNAYKSMNICGMDDTGGVTVQPSAGSLEQMRSRAQDAQVLMSRV